MNEDEATRLLANLGERVPVGPAPVDVTLEQGKGNSRRRRAIQVVSGAAAVAVIAVGVFILGPSVGGSSNLAAQQGTQPTQVDVISFEQGMQRFASWSAEDWTQNSDWAAEVLVVAEHPTEEDQTSGSVVPREVELAVQRVVWQRAVPAHELPQRLSLEAAGWTKSGEGGSTLTPRAFEGEPRMEIGHSYVVALVWVPRACSPGDAAEAAHWSTLGAGTVIPYDEGRLGYGESEGRTVSGDEDQAQPRTLERELLGRDASTLKEKLTSAPAKPRSDVFPTANC